MGTKVECYCGLACSECSYREDSNCKGCIASKGNPFYGGECAIAKCCKDKGIQFCGECGDMPCELLSKFSYDKEQGDNGARIENCRTLKRALVAEARAGIDAVSICGHHCDYCFLGEWCGGCRSGYNCCSFALISEGGVCPNVKCATEKRIDGCYECNELEQCKKGYYGNEGEFVAKATALFIHTYGKECYSKSLKAAIDGGLDYPKSFDETNSVEGAFKLLEKYKEV